MLRPGLVAFFCFVVVTLPAFLVRPHQTAPTSPLRRLTTTSEDSLNLNPSMSGDGRFVVFESTANPTDPMSVAGFHTLRLDLLTESEVSTQLALSRAVAPAISQDGSCVAFASKDDPLGTNRDGNSEIFFYDGNTLIQITDTLPGDLADRTTRGNFQPSISDDGHLIAFSSNCDLTNHNPDANLEIVLFDTVEHSFTQLTNSSGTAGCRDAKISGNGSRVAYICERSGPTNELSLELQDFSGTAQSHLVAADTPSLQLAYGRAISDDGMRIVYSAETANGASQVFLFDGRRNTTRQITALGARGRRCRIAGNDQRRRFAHRLHHSAQRDRRQCRPERRALHFRHSVRAIRTHNLSTGKRHSTNRFLAQ